MGILKVGVIGTGQLGQHHVRIYSELPQTHLVGVVDSDRGRASEIGQRFGVCHDTQFQKLLGQVEAVSVAVPTSKHWEVVEACLSAGVHVLVEKPLASSLEEGRNMVQLANHKGVILQVGHVERFNPVRDLVQDIIRSPEFIECHRLAPYQLRGTDVDVVLDLMIHDLDLILSFGLGQVTKVEALGVTVLSQQVDFANARVEFSEGCVVNFTASRMSTGRLRKMRLFQENLYLSVDYQSRKGVVYRQQGFATIEPCVVEESIQAGEEEPLKRELEAFVQSIQTGKSIGVSGEEGFAALELAHSIIHSIRGIPFPTVGHSNIAMPSL